MSADAPAETPATADEAGRSGPPGVFVHRLGLCESLEVGAGTRIWPFAHVMAGAVVGRECNVGEHAFVESGAVVGDRVTIKNHALIWDRVRIEDDVFVGPAAVFTNDLRPRAEVKKDREEFLPTLVRRGATIGANATVLCGATVGAYAFVAAGAVVAGDVLDHALVAGNPARQIGWACRCGRRLDDTLACSCGDRYERSEGGLVLSPASSSDRARAAD